MWLRFQRGDRIMMQPSVLQRNDYLLPSINDTEAVESPLVLVTFVIPPLTHWQDTKLKSRFFPLTRPLKEFKHLPEFKSEAGPYCQHWFNLKAKIPIGNVFYSSVWLFSSCPAECVCWDRLTHCPASFFTTVDRISSVHEISILRK